MHNDLIIADSSPLIALARIGQLALLPRLYSKTLIPPEVWDEVTVQGKGRPGAKEVNEASWLEIRTPDPLLVGTVGILVDSGEAEVIALAQAIPASFVLLDDSHARKVAKRLNLRIIGTVGLLLRARWAGLLNKLRPYLESLQVNNIYICQELIDAVLRDVGE